jgi:hypothetical protein
MIIVFALAMSRPFSMIVVASSTSYLCATKSDHHLFEQVLAHLPVADADLACGTSRCSRSAIE